MVETAGHIIIPFILARQAGECSDYVASAKIYTKLAAAEIDKAYTYVMNSPAEDVALFKAVETEE